MFRRDQRGGLRRIPASPRPSMVTSPPARSPSSPSGSASPSIRYRLVRQNGWRRPRLRVRPAKPKTGFAPRGRWRRTAPRSSSRPASPPWLRFPHLGLFRTRLGGLLLRMEREGCGHGKHEAETEQGSGVSGCHDACVSRHQSADIKGGFKFPTLQATNRGEGGHSTRWNQTRIRRPVSRQSWPTIAGVCRASPGYSPPRAIATTSTRTSRSRSGAVSTASLAVRASRPGSTRLP